MSKRFGITFSTYRQEVFHGNHKAGVADEPVPQAEDVSDRLHQDAATKQHEVKTGYQVAEAEDVDPCGARDEDEAENQPEEVAENKHLHHVQVGSVYKTQADGFPFKKAKKLVLQDEYLILIKYILKLFD